MLRNPATSETFFTSMPMEGAAAQAPRACDAQTSRTIHTRVRVRRGIAGGVCMCRACVCACVEQWSASVSDLEEILGVELILYHPHSLVRAALVPARA